MAYKRELILQRLVAIAQDIPGIAYVARNEEMRDESASPAILILDADETTEDIDQPAGSRPWSGNAAPFRVGMTPEIWLCHSGMPEDVGTAVNGFIAAIIKAVLLDPTLREIVGNNGHIRYEGSATGLSRTRQMSADAAVSFTFTYTIYPAGL